MEIWDRLEVEYEDDEVVMYRKPTQDEVKQMIEEIMAREPKFFTIQDLRKYFIGIVGEDKLRWALNELIRDGIVTFVTFRGYIHVKWLDMYKDQIRSRRRPIWLWWGKHGKAKR